MMKFKLFLLFIILFIFSTSLAIMAEEIVVSDEIEINSDSDYYYIEERETNRPRQRTFKANGGPAIAWMNINIENLNNNLPTGFAPLPATILLKGGGGLIGSAQGNRFGGYGLSGRVQSTGIEGERVILDINYAGFLYERNIYIQDKIDIAAAGVIGKGTANLDLFYTNSEFNEPNQRIARKDFIAFEPRINFHYKAATFIGVDFTLGYLLAIDIDKDTNSSYYYQPLEDSDISNFVASLRFSFGF